MSEGGAEDVGSGGVMARAESVTNALGGEMGEGLKAFGKLGEQGGAGGGEHFVRFVALGERNATGGEDFQGGGGGQGEASVGTADKTGAFDNGAGQHAGSAEGIEGEAGADDIDDGIDGADLMELDVLGGATVDFTFGDGDPLEDGQGAFLDPGVEGALGDQAADLGMGTTVGMGLGGILGAMGMGMGMMGPMGPMGLMGMMGMRLGV